MDMILPCALNKALRKNEKFYMALEDLEQDKLNKKRQLEQLSVIGSHAPHPHLHWHP